MEPALRHQRLALLRRAQKTPREHLVHGGEVVRALDGLDLEDAVFLSRRRAVDGHHHARHGLLALRVGDVVALDTPRHGFHTHGLRQRRAGAGGALLLAGQMRVALFQRVAGVLARQLDQLVLGAALRLMQRDLRALTLREHILDVLRLLGQLHAQQLTGGLPAIVVKLQNELRENLRAALVARALQRVAFRPDHAPAAHKEHLHHRVEFVRAAGEDVLIAAAHVDRLLPLHQALRVAHPVADLRRLLKAHRFRRLRHLRLQALHDRVGLPAQKVDDLLHHLAVRLRRGQARARGQALAQLMVQTRPAVHARPDRHGAGAQREQAA